MKPSKFIPNVNNKKLLLGFIAFCFAVIGTVIGFTASHFHAPVLFMVGYICTAVGVIGGFVYVFYRLYIEFFRSKE